MTKQTNLNNLTILQWNIRGINSKKGELLNIIKDIDLISICETWLSTDFHFSIPGFIVYRKDSSRPRFSGLCVLVKDNLRSQVEGEIFHLEGSLDTLGISISTFQGRLLLISIYKHPEFYIKHEHWCVLFESFKDHDQVIITGDFNSHNVSWGCGHTSYAGKSLQKSLDSYNLSILNNGSPTRLTPPHQQASANDLTIISSDLLSSCSWRVMENSYNSDHFPIITTLNIKANKINRFYHKIDNSLTDWSTFKDFLILRKDVISSEISSKISNPPEALELLTHYIINATEMANEKPVSRSYSNKPKSSKKPPPAPWWDGDCQTAFQNRKIAIKNFRNRPSLSDQL